MKGAIVSGRNSGIGQAIVLDLARKGADVVIDYVVRPEATDAAIPLRRLARPEEIAGVVGFLAGDGASYLAATTVFVDGGIMQGSVGL